jgi:large subunit ribosomal protein L25
VYGNHANTAIQCPEKELTKLYGTAGESTLIELVIGTEKVPVLVHEIACHPVTDRIVHVDFYAVDMKKEVEANVPLRMNGEAVAVKEHGGILVTPTSHLTVKCLPADLPHEIVVDVTVLAEIGSMLAVKDITIPANVKVLETPETVIALIQEARKEEEVAPAAAVPAEGAAATGEGAPAAEGTEGAEKKDEKEEK